MKVKVRLAPSPTGLLHIGNAQSALYNWLFARKNGGEFYLRIEDTDRERSTKEYERSITEALAWLGLKWDPPSYGFGQASGDFVRQSENIKRHRTLLEELLKKSKAFYCHHSQEELEIEHKDQEAKKEAPRHICEHKNTAQGKEPGGIIRLAVSDSDRKISFNDQIRGKLEFRESLLGDFSIARSVDDPLYQFAVVVDDIDMEITNVIRGEDHISNTPKQILIYKALGKTPPQFAHLPLILAPDRSKLSKRHGGTAVVDYKKDYLPEAIINFLGGLSYTFSKDVLTKEEMIGEFELSRVHKSGAVFDVKKLNWINSQYIKKLSPEEFKKILRLAQDKLPEIPDAAVPLITERLEKLSDVNDFDYFWKEPEYDKELLIWKNSSPEDVKKSLEEVLEILLKFDFNSQDLLRESLDNIGKKIENRGLVYWPLRVALTGKDKSPDPVDVAFVLGKEKTLERVKKAARLLL